MVIVKVKAIVRVVLARVIAIVIAVIVIIPKQGKPWYYCYGIISIMGFMIFIAGIIMGMVNNTS